MLKHKVKPEIIGMAQINGFRDETDTTEGYGTSGVFNFVILQ
jgi:hypothetical protein